jgi:exopolyphosphatase/guanosine-5'-triphosphate,3'-diphosphate pyrophosphatase
VPPRAAIDVGSNSILLTILDDQGGILTDQATVVGLGTGLGSRGLFQSDRMEAAETVLRSYVTEAGAHGIAPWAIKAVATSAARRSMNASTFFARIQRDLGLKVAIISGDEEARLTWVGSLRDLPLADDAVMVMDLGGGSTELAWGTPGTVEDRVSLEIGSVRLTEQFFPDGDVTAQAVSLASRHIDQALAAVRLASPPKIVVGVAGTVTTLMAMALGLEQYDGARVHGARLGRMEIGSLLDRLSAATADERRALVPSSPERANFLVAGALIVDRVLGKTMRPSLVVSDRGLRFGLLG